MIRDGTLTDMIEIVASNLANHFLESEHVVFRHAKSLEIVSDPPMRFTIDGEVVDKEPVQFNVVPSAIKMYMGPECVT